MDADSAAEFARLREKTKHFDGWWWSSREGAFSKWAAWSPIGPAIVECISGDVGPGQVAAIQVTGWNGMSVAYEYTAKEFGANYQVLYRLADETHERLFLQWMAKWTQVAASRHQAGKAKAAEARKLQKAQGKGRKLIGPPFAADVPEIYRPVFEPGAKRRYYEYDRKLFIDVEIVKATQSTVTTRGAGAPEAYTFDIPRELFIRQLAEACLRETGDELRAGAILEAIQ